MKLKIILSCLLTLSLVSCQKETNNKVLCDLHVNVNADKSTKQLSEIAKTSLVILPTSDSLLIGNISRIVSSQNAVYLSDAETLYKFSLDGTCEGRIKRQGQGPEEYTGISDFQIDNDDNAWILSRSNQAIYQYSWDNQLHQQLKINLWMERLFFNDKGFYIYTGNEMGFDNTCQLHYLNLQTGEIEQDFKPIDKNKAGYLHVQMPNIFQRAKSGSVYLTQVFNDTIYALNPSSCEPKYVIDLGGRNIPPSFYQEKYGNIMDFFMKLHQENRYAYGTDIFVETDSHYWISYYYQQQYHLSILPKEEGKEQLHFNTLYVDKLFGYPIDLSEAALFIQNNGRIIIPLQPDEIKAYGEDHLTESQQEELKKTIHYEDDQNPLLLVIEPV